MESQLTQETTVDNISQIIEIQQKYFQAGHTKDIGFRKKQLKKLYQVIKSHESEIEEALKVDLNMHPYESMSIDYAPVYAEIKLYLRKLEQWSAPEYVNTSLFHTPGSSKIIKEPYGNVLIISPWNYPFRLTLMPVIASIAAGNSALIKPSEVSAASSSLIKKLIDENFEEGLLKVVEGGPEVTTEILKHRWDFICFTGSPHVGKIVYQAASKFLTPVLLELGGKNPAVIDQQANLDLAAKRLIWGKLIKAGQTCLAPDYLFVHESVKAKFIEKLKEQYAKQYGSSPLKGDALCKIINQKHYERVKAYISQGDVIFGGEFDDDNHLIGLTLLENVKEDSPVMQDEIFGPVLPIFTYKDLDEVIQYANNREKPLGAYIFSSNPKTRKRFSENIHCGGITENDFILHISCSEMPFGGVGESGVGAYHGKFGFDSFSHKKSVLYRGRHLLDPFLRYAPYSGARKKLMKWMIENFL